MNTQGVCTGKVAELWLIYCVFFSCCIQAKAESDTLLPSTQTWRYIDYGELPAANWYATNYSDNDWKNNSGQFGYGEGDEHTLIGFGPNPLAKYVTTYFRTAFLVANPAAYSSVSFRLLRDPGAVVYLNGEELFRDNLPAAPETILNNTYALSCLNPPLENRIVTNVFPASVLRPGSNYVAVEIHQCSATSSDLSFGLSIEGELDAAFATVTRGPYLQIGTSSNIIVRWRTSIPTTSRVRFGTAAGNLDQSAVSAVPTDEHEVLLPNLSAATQYFYEIGTATQVLAGDDSYFFVTAPLPGSTPPVRIWAIGDFGTGYGAQHDVRDAYANFTGTRYTDLWLMLGDNAYCCGFDHEYQAYVFDVYPALLRQTVVWPTVGNHDTAQISSLSDDFPYYRIFTMPTNAQAGGLVSGTEHYYSFDYANIHFICLDSMTAIFRTPNSAMLNWLKADLAANTRDWIIAYWHHPPYTKGSHNSDGEGDLIQLRQNFLPILENYGVDLVLCGHSHSYERSHLVDGHYGLSGTIEPRNILNAGDGRVDGAGAYIKPAGGLGEHRGAVYIVDGSSGGQGGGGSLDHPVMFHSTLSAGSLVIDIEGQRLDATFVRGDGAIEDYFTIDKRSATNVIPRMDIARVETNALITWPTSLPDYRLESKGVVDTGVLWTVVGENPGTNGRRKVVTLPANTGTNRFFRLQRMP